MLKEFTPLQRVVLAGLAGLIILSAAAVALGRHRALPPSVVPPPAASRARMQRQWLAVTVTGAVVRPGVYTLRPGARAWDAVQAAGGLTPTADVGRLNLAKPLKNGAAVNIKDKPLAVGPARSLRPRAPHPTAVPTPASPAPLAPPASRPRFARAAPALSWPLSLNTATRAQLARVPGLDKTLAGRLVAYRQAHGGFQRVADVLLVKGFTPTIFAQAQPYLVP